MLYSHVYPDQVHETPLSSILVLTHTHTHTHTRTHTVLRCVGIASRCITNFVSAHDTDLNRAVDKFYNEDGEEISLGDSVWWGIHTYM